MNMARSIGIRGFLLAAAVSLLGTMAGCGDGGTPAPPLTTQQNSVVAGDFDRDGRLDLAVTTAFFSGALSLTGEVELFFQDPFNPGFFSLPVVFPVGNNPAQIAVADLNGDLHPDLVVANTDSDTVSVLLNNPILPGSFFPAVDFATGPAPLSVAIGDLDRDSFPDIAVAVADGVDILFQTPAGRGAFFAPEFQALAGGAFSVAVGDLDGDGFADIAAAGTDAAFVFFQDPLFPGAFFLPEGFTAGLNPNGVAVADIDRDGLLDIAVANAGSIDNGSGASISVLIQDPLVAGNFLSGGDFPAPAGAQNLAVGDLNGDGFPDIAVPSVPFATANPGVISVFLQNPVTGNFVLTETHQDGANPLSVAIGDLDGDGRPDIAVQDGPSVLFQIPAPALPGRFFEEVLI